MLLNLSLAENFKPGFTPGRVVNDQAIQAPQGRQFRHRHLLGGQVNKWQDRRAPPRYDFQRTARILVSFFPFCDLDANTDLVPGD